MQGLLPFCFSVLAFFATLGCYRNEKGSLHVAAAQAGSYEIYKIASEQPIQLSSETIGSYNADVALDPGSYLIFADCSSELVVIRSRRKTELIADTIKFLPPVEVPKKEDSFIIQCTRHEKTQTRQRLINAFSLNVLRGPWNLLVGMTPLKLDPHKLAGKDKPQVDKYQLSALRVAKFDNASNGARYFVSPKNSMVSVTESQKLGDWLFLLQGDYNIELNGSSVQISVAVGEQQSIQPAFLRVASPPEARLDLGQTIQGNPLFVEINGGHWLNLNETYPVLPGKARLRLVGSESSSEVDLVSDELIEKKAHAVQVNLNCPPWDWTCLGSRKIYLYQKDAHYPFAQGVTDVPLLFFEDDAWITLEGSREIRLHIKRDKDFIEYKTGSIRLIPKPEYKSGVITDLARIETTGEGAIGNTLDLPLDLPSTVYVMPGTFIFSEYLSSTSAEGERRKLTRKISVSSSETLEFEFATYLSERKFRTLSKHTPISEQIRRSARRKLSTQRYRTPRPLAHF